MKAYLNAAQYGYHGGSLPLERGANQWAHLDAQRQYLAQHGQPFTAADGTTSHLLPVDIAPHNEQWDEVTFPCGSSQMMHKSTGSHCIAATAQDAQAKHTWRDSFSWSGNSDMDSPNGRMV